MILECKNMEVSFDGRPVLHDFSLSIGKGEIIALVGESGSGKTTAIGAMMGLLPVSGSVTKGEIQFEGKTLEKSGDWDGIRGKTMSMIFQDSGAMLNPIRTIGSQYVEFITNGNKIPKKQAWDMACEMLEKMGLYDGNAIMKSIPSQLSGGMRQRVGIAMAMTFQPDVLFADEPTAALDVTTQAQIVRQMMELRDNFGTSIVMVTHNLGVAAYMADKILVMEHGQVVEQGNSDDILHHAKHDYTKRLLNAVPDLKGASYV